MSLNIGRGHLGEQVKASPLEPQAYHGNFIPERQLPRPRENVWGAPALANEVVAEFNAAPAAEFFPEPPAEVLAEPPAVNFQA